MTLSNPNSTGRYSAKQGTWSPHRITWAGWLVLAAVVLTMAGSAVLMHRQMQLVNKTLRVHPEGLGIWDFAQLQRQLLTLQNDVDTAVGRNRVEDRDHLRLQLDLVFSRLGIMSQGESSKAVHRLVSSHAGYREILVLVNGIEATLENFIENPAVHGPAVQQQLQKAILLSQESHSIAYNELLRRRETLTTTLREIQLQTILLGTAVVILTGLLIFIIWRTMAGRLTQVLGLLEELRQSEERFRILVESALIGIFVYQEQKLIYANDAFLRLLGFQTLGELNAQNSQAGPIRPAGQSLAGDGRAASPGDKNLSTRYEVKLIRQDGSSVWVDQQEKQITWDGRPAAMVFNLDISERKTAETVLLQAKEASEAANRAKSNFLANMNHELRTPMTAVIGFTNLILKGAYGEPGPQIREAVEDIRNSGDHLLTMINEVLDISKIEAGRMDLYRVPSSPWECIQSVTKKMSAAASEKGLHLRAEPQTEQVNSGFFDPHRISQVLLNLVDNAIKFTREGEVRIGAKSDNGHFTFWVADTGIGIPRQAFENLFHEFQRMDSSISREVPGTGLGLAIAKGIVEKHGGRIWVDSQVGLGSTFWFSLPGGGNP